MTDFTNTWYVNAGNQSTTGYYAVAKRQPSAAVVAGQIVRQFTTPAINDERCFVCITAGTTSGATDAPWVLGRGAKTNDGTATWQECTGVAAVNGDAVNTPTYSQARAISVTADLGTIIKRNNGASFQICQATSGAVGTSEPVFSDTAGAPSSDGVWISLGPVGSFVGGGAPNARIQNAVQPGWFWNGNTIYVADNHAELQTTAISWGPSTQGSNVDSGRMLCHNHAGPYPPTGLATGATVSVTGAGQHFTYNMIGSMYVYGLTIKVGVGLTTSLADLILSPNAGSYLYFDNCSFWLAGGQPNNSSYIQVGGTGVLQATVVWNNCTVRFASAANYIGPQNGSFIWQNTGQVLAPGSALPDYFTLFNFGTSLGTDTDIVLEAIDLSQITDLWGFNLTNLTGTMVIKDCKLNAAWIFDPPPVPGLVFQLARSGSDATARYQSSRYTCDGAETTETTVTRVGGAVDPTNQPQSRKIATTVNAEWLRPFFAEPYAIWNATVGAAVSLIVHGTVHDDEVPNNDDVWLELEYMGSAGSPLGTIVTTTKADVFAANAPVAADATAWNNAPAYVAGMFDGVAVDAVLTNGNRTAMHSTTATGGSGARSIAVKGSRKYYFEMTVSSAVHGAFDVAGILRSDGTYGNLINGGNCTVVYIRTGNIWSNNADTHKTLGPLATGAVIAMAIDINARRAWLRQNDGPWNGDPTANPVTGVGGVVIGTGSFSPAVGFGGPGSAIGDAMTINSGQIPYSMLRPDGFADWADIWSHFKLVAELASPPPALPGYIHVRVRAAKPSTTFYIDPQVFFG